MDEEWVEEWGFTALTIVEMIVIVIGLLWSLKWMC
jgi:hypothetical protein